MYVVLLAHTDTCTYTFLYALELTTLLAHELHGGFKHGLVLSFNSLDFQPFICLHYIHIHAHNCTYRHTCTCIHLYSGATDSLFLHCHNAPSELLAIEKPV